MSALSRGPSSCAATGLFHHPRHPLLRGKWVNLIAGVSTPFLSAGLSTPLIEVFEQEYRELRPRAPIPPLDIRFRRFTSLNTTIRLREGRLQVRLSDLLEYAPESVHHAIAHILLAKLYKKLPIARVHADRYRRYVSSEADRKSVV